MRRFSIGFLAKSQKTLLPYTLLNIFHINPRYFLFLCIFFTVLNLHKETIILTTATTTHTELFPLLATTGSASVAQGRRKLIGFLAKSQKTLHPCIETLNSRNLGLAKDSFKVSFGFRTLSRPRLIKDTKNVKNHWFYCVFARKC